MNDWVQSYGNFTRLGGFCLVMEGGGHISGKGLVEKEALKMTHSEGEADIYDPDWEVDPKIELEVDIKESDDMA